MKFVLATSALTLTYLAAPVLAQEVTLEEALEGYEPVCEGRGANGMVAMLLCPEGLSADNLAREGMAFCRETKPCGAWMWDDEAFVPAEAPDSHDKLPGDSVRAALGVWMNEAGQMVVLQADAKN